MFCLPQLLLDFIPIPITALFLLGSILLGLSAAGKRFRRWTLVIMLSLPSIALLSAWMCGITAECDKSFSPASRILDPSIVSTLHALTLAGTIAAMFIFLYWALAAPDRRTAIRGIIAALGLLTTLLTIESNLIAFRHIFGTYGVAPALSPDRAREARFVPLDHSIDGVAGMIIWRKVGEFWWHRAYDLPEELEPHGILMWLDNRHIQFSNGPTYKAVESIDLPNEGLPTPNQGIK